MTRIIREVTSCPNGPLTLALSRGGERGLRIVPLSRVPGALWVTFGLPEGT